MPGGGRRAALGLGAGAVALAWLLAWPAAARACSMCKGSLDDPAAARLALGYGLSVSLMLAVLFGVLIVGGSQLARAVDPAGYARFLARLRHFGGWRGRLAALAVAGLFVLSAVYTTGAARYAPPERLPVAALAERPLVRGGIGPLTGRPVVVTFFATWCLPCRGQIDDLVQIQREMGDKVSIVAVNIFESNPDLPAERHVHADGTVHFHSAPPPDYSVGAWLAAQGIELPVIAASRDIDRAFGGVSRIPSTFVFGPDGRLAEFYINDPVGEFVRPDLASLRAAVVGDVK
jgi:thiol-disulfide isomerase/thioredoxin